LPLLLIIFLFFSYQQLSLENESLKVALQKSIDQLQDSHVRTATNKEETLPIPELVKDCSSKTNEHKSTDNKILIID